MISLVINTCANGTKAADTLSSGRQPHAQRSFALRNFILPAALADPTFDEVIVAGEWEPGNGYVYIEVPSVHFSCVDALAQRQAGFERSAGDWVVFQHDDHILEDRPEWSWKMRVDNITEAEADILIPSRYTRLRNVNGERLYDGEPKSRTVGHAASILDDPPQMDTTCVIETGGYISGHCAIYRREVLEKCPWGEVAKIHTWDVAHTMQIRDAGFNIEWSDALRVYDCEAGATPW